MKVKKENQSFDGRFVFVQIILRDFFALSGFEFDRANEASGSANSTHSSSSFCQLRFLLVLL